MKLRCKAFGCGWDGHSSCERCGTDLYEGFIPREACWFRHCYHALWLWRRGKRWRKHECDHCKAVMFFTEEYCCSDKCYDEWVPF